MTKYVDIVFDGPPSRESGRFVEVENDTGHSIKFGEWIQRPDGYWVIRIARSALALLTPPAGEPADDELIRRLCAIRDHDWRVSFLAHTSDTAGEAATRIAALTDEQTMLRDILMVEDDETLIEVAREIVESRNSLAERADTAESRIKELDAECHASMATIAQERERADRAERERNEWQRKAWKFEEHDKISRDFLTVSDEQMKVAEAALAAQGERLTEATWRGREFYINGLYVGEISRCVSENWRELLARPLPPDAADYIIANRAAVAHYNAEHEAAPWRVWLMLDADGAEAGWHATEAEAKTALEARAMLAASPALPAPVAASADARLRDAEQRCADAAEFLHPMIPRMRGIPKATLGDEFHRISGRNVGRILAAYDAIHPRGLSAAPPAPADERAKIVAWLPTLAGYLANTDNHGNKFDAPAILKFIADRIKAGAHMEAPNA